MASLEWEAKVEVSSLLAQTATVCGSRKSSFIGLIEHWRRVARLVTLVFVSGHGLRVLRWGSLLGGESASLSLPLASPHAHPPSLYFK